MRRNALAYYVPLWMRFGALACLIASIITLLVLSGSVLDSFGYRYDVQGGSFLEKIHPATILVALSVLLRLAAEDSLSSLAKRLSQIDRELVLAALGFVLVELYAVIALRIPLTPPIDSYLLPLLYCLALKGLNQKYVKLIAYLLILIFLANATFAFYEKATGTRLFFVIPDTITGHPEDPNGVFDWKGHLAWDTRATALLGHPLENAMMTGCFILVLQLRAAAWIPLPTRIGIILFEMAALLPFGGRVAFVFAVLMTIGWTLFKAFQAVRSGYRLSPRHQAALFVVVPMVLVIVATAYQLGAFDEIVQRFVDDQGSAQTRITMWRLFEPIPWSNILLGPDPDVVATHQRLQGLELGIESFWAGLPLQYGIVMSALIMAGWALLSLHLVRATTRDSWLVIIFYFIVASTSAGLASKTTSMGILVFLVLTLGVPLKSGALQLSRRPLGTPAFQA